jgi:hypothetical protein
VDVARSWLTAAVAAGDGTEAALALRALAAQRVRGLRFILYRGAGMALGAALKSGFRLKPPPEQILAILVIAALAAVWRVPLPWIILIFAPICVGMSLRRAFVARAGV